MTVVWPPHLNNFATLPCEIQKLQFGRLQQGIHRASTCINLQNHWDHKIIENV